LFTVNEFNKNSLFSFLSGLIFLELPSSRQMKQLKINSN
jgi:hypothetical protein